MALELASTEDKRISEVQHYLQNQNEVLGASVWMKGGVLLARVTIHRDSTLNGSDLQGSCRKKFGDELAPRMILLERVSPQEDEKVA